MAFITQNNMLYVKGLKTRKKEIDIKNEYFLLQGNVKSIVITESMFGDEIMIILDLNGDVWFKSNSKSISLDIENGYLVGVNWKIADSEISDFYPIKLELNFTVDDIAMCNDTLYLLSHDGYIHKMEMGSQEIINISDEPIFIQMSCGIAHLIAIDKKGNLWSYYNNMEDSDDYDEKYKSLGQFGIEDAKYITESPHMKQITKDINYVFISCDIFSINAIDIDGQMYVSGLCQKQFDYPEGDTFILYSQPIRKENCLIYDEMGEDEDETITYYYLPELTKMQSDIKIKYVSSQFWSLFIDTGGNLFICHGEKIKMVPFSSKFVSAWICDRNTALLKDESGQLYNYNKDYDIFSHVLAKTDDAPSPIQIRKSILYIDNINYILRKESVVTDVKSLPNEKSRSSFYINTYPICIY